MSLINGQKNNYRTTDNEEFTDYDEDDFNFSPRTKNLLIAAGVVASVLILWLFCFALPGMFIPQSRILDGIPKVKDIGVQLVPVTAQTEESWQLQRWGNGATIATEMDNDILESELLIEVSAIKKERIILLGDVHGSYTQLRKLLRKIKFNKHSDHLFVLGDFISKGPDLRKVLDYLIDIRAGCILGNHEYYALENYAHFHNLDQPFFITGNRTENTVEDLPDMDLRDPEFALARKLEPQHIEYINQCPLMVRLGEVPLHSKKTNGGKKHAQGLAVHAGVRWDLDLEWQEPLDCLEMRSYIGPHYNETTEDPHDDNAVSWSKIYNQKQKAGEAVEEFVVYYGHDARRGVNFKKYTKGLDSGCVRGDALTGLVMWKEKTEKSTLYKEKLVSVKC